MSRTFSTLAATAALALAGFAASTVSAHAAAPFDGTWIIDVASDTISGGGGGDATCPALRLRVQITDNQVSGDFRRSFPEVSNVVENGGNSNSSQVIGFVQPDGSVAAQWQNFHAAGQLAGNRGVLMMESECGPLRARARLLGYDNTETVASTSWSNISSGSSESQSATASRQDGYNVYFAFDKSTLTPKGQEVVTSAVRATQGDQTTRIALVGKADLSGTDPYNMALSERRADTVRAAMVSGGVPSSRIDVRWVGEREPPVPTSAGAREPLDRVVEVGIQ
jgi:outer membrane protein OmpA-like peptidoglycan-associated protein